MYKTKKCVAHTSSNIFIDTKLTSVAIVPNQNHYFLQGKLPWYTVATEGEWNISVQDSHIPVTYSAHL